MRDPKGHYQNMSELFDFFETGKIKPHVAAQYSLDDFLPAFAELSERRAIGKVVLKP